MELNLNVYDKGGTVIKTCSAEIVDLEYGTIRSLMEILNVEDIEDTGALLKSVYAAWKELTEVLGQAFPDMEYDDWDHVKLKELIPIVIQILKYSFAEILTIPQDPKNQIAG